ncbi:MAG: hypothetical protein RLZZ53_2351 [Acidobacteriota bacterium]|jgi:hypothetical protein
MAELKTQATKASVSKFLNAVEDEGRRKDCKAVAAMMTKVTKAKAVMWGPAIVGFGDHSYTGSTGKSVDWFVIGFSPRKAAVTLYLMGGYDKALLAKLGAHKKGGSCLYIKSLDDVSTPTLEKLIALSVKNIKKKKGQ